MARVPMIGKMPGDEWQKMANMRCLYGFMFTHPGKENPVHEHGVWPVDRVERLG